MSEIDKMARELLAQWHLDRGLGEKVAQDCRSGVIDIPEIYWDLIRAALLTAPPGWKLVPVEPTQDMLNEAKKAWTAGVSHDEANSIRYESMISATPEVK